MIRIEMNTANENITIGGVTHARWQWRQGYAISSIPTAEDKRIIQSEGLMFWEDEPGIWYIIDPQAIEVE